MDPEISLAGPAIRPLLMRAGLMEKEADVYLSTLALKIARVTTIAKAAKQSRSHTYLILKALSEKGLVSEIERGKVIHFVAEPPERLLRYLESREQELRDVATLVQGAMPLLSSLTQPLIGQPRVTMLHGLDGMKQIYRDLLSQEFMAFFNAEKMFEAFGSNVVHLVFGKAATLRGRELFVDNAAARRYMKEVQTDETYQIRLLSKSLAFDAEAIIFADTVALCAYDDDKTIVRIENRNIADSFRAWFEGLWKVSSSV